MSPAWHILRKDARLLWVPWSAWMLLQLLAMGVAGWLEQAHFEEPDDPRGMALTSFYVFVAVVDWAIAYLFVGIALHDDPTAGAPAGWITRPISARQLLAAKAAGLVLIFWILPAVLRLPWWWMHGYGAGHIGWAFAETVGVFALITAPAFWLATLTHDASQFHRWTLALIGGLGVGLVVWSASMDGARPGILAFAPLALWLLLLFALSATHQVLTRRTRRSLGMIAAGFAIVLFFPGFFRADNPEVSVGAHALTATLHAAEEAGGRLTIDGLPPDSFVTVSTASIPDSEEASGRPIAGGSETDQKWLEIESIATQLPDTGWVPLGIPMLDSPTSLWIHASRPANLHVRGSGWRIMYAMSLSLTDTRYRDGPYSLRIGAVREEVTENPRTRRLLLMITETYPRLQSDLWLEEIQRATSHHYLLVTPSGVQRMYPETASVITESTVAIRISALTLPLDAAQSPSWLDQARLVSVAVAPLGQFALTMPLTHAPVSAAPAAPLP